MEKKEEEKVEDVTSAAQVQVEIVDEPVKEVKEKTEDDDVKDTWDADTTEDEQEEGIVLQRKCARRVHVCIVGDELM